jgi:hypothetical protein
LVPLLSILGRRGLDEEERENLRAAMMSELAAAGLDDDSEATAYGKELDDVIDRFGHC